jgi:hypothetical protein
MIARNGSELLRIKVWEGDLSESEICRADLDSAQEQDQPADSGGRAWDCRGGRRRRRRSFRQHAINDPAVG